MASLRDLGLSEYEARAYRSLLKTGPTTAKELSRVSDVPMGRIYDVLNSIEQYNLVRSQSASRPKKYVAVEPETALDRLLADKKRELEEKADQYESIVDELEGELETTEPVEERFWTAAVGADEAADLLVERIAAADARIVMVLSTYTEQYFDVTEVGSAILDGLEAALERGVEVELLMKPDLAPTLPAEFGDRYRETLSGYGGFEVRTVEDVSGTFTLIDRNEVVIEVPHPLKSEEALAMLNLKDHEFAASVREEFKPRWADATELTL
ncbi:TrmB family transcriptional regulator [Haloglomus irregulare]|jgi:sugar-specific transcriptional regulator TrmB|uniref:TrmB family transcriptional regulator n=1 Tax=Haloglomus irregulare TaxID=2234134 RepID=A0A554NCV2_9EURY|nr:helix-turn-helix domain-containing protein [Haloglomus irregulare]TSD15155.1 TrmB family transcriptional regulator [Haloglomus irregulare]